MKISENMKKETSDLIEFLNKSPTAEWAVCNLAKDLESEGFEKLTESDKFELNPGDKFYIEKNDSSLLAGIIGNADLEKNGFKIIGAHTDSPGFQVKYEGMYEEEGYKQLGVEIYGGPLIASWTDRDLSLAGKVALDKGGKIVTKRWKSESSLLRISQLPIHLNRDVNDEGLKLEKEQHLPPMIGQADEKEFTRDSIKGIIAEDMGIEPSEISDFDLKLYDTQPASLLGLDEEFFASGRVDNLMACHCAISSLTNVNTVPENTVIVSLFDNEEVGSNTASGGASPFLPNILERVTLSLGLTRAEYLVTLANSFLLSIDGAHAVHPNYPDAFEKDHKVQLNKGPVIKLNANQKYVTDPGNTAEFKRICNNADLPSQVYINRADKPSGSTIGPITSTRTGIRTMDIGPPMVSMHSVREMAGVKDTHYLTRAITEYIGT